MINKRLWIVSLVAAIVAGMLHNMTPAVGQAPIRVEYSSSSLSALGVVTAVDVEGDYAYLGAYDRLMIVDISDPLKPVKLGETRQLINVANIMCTGVVSDIAVSDGYAYVAADTSDVQIIDISDPLHPHAVGRAGSSAAIGVTIEGIHLVVASNWCVEDIVAGFMVIYDITDRTDPMEIGGIYHYGYAPYVQSIVTIAKDHVFAAAARSRGVVVAAIDGSAYFLYTHADWPDSPVGFTPISLIAYDNYLYVSASAEDRDDVLAIFDISDPFRPKWLTSFAKQRADAMAISGKTLYIAHDHGGGWRSQTIDVYDLTDPRAPNLLFSHALEEGIIDIDAQDNCVYAGTTSSLHVFCTNDPVVTLTPSLTPTSTPSLTPTATPSPSPTAMGERRLYLPLIHGDGA